MTVKEQTNVKNGALMTALLTAPIFYFNYRQYHRKAMERSMAHYKMD